MKQDNECTVTNKDTNRNRIAKIKDSATTTIIFAYTTSKKDNNIGFNDNDSFATHNSINTEFGIESK